MIDAIPALDADNSTTMQQTRTFFGHVHMNESATRKTANMFGIIFTGNMELCDACALAKGKQKNLRKEITTTTNTIGGRLYIDVLSV
jgi:hypothetical protein